MLFDPQHPDVSEYLRKPGMLPPDRLNGHDAKWYILPPPRVTPVGHRPL
jgi:hypothetical protein